MSIQHGISLVVVQNGRRVSKQIHRGVTKAEAEQSALQEKQQYVKRLQEANRSDQVPSVVVQELLCE